MYSFEQARADGVGIVHIRGDGDKGGLTVAYRLANSFKGCRMVDCAVQACSIEDNFVRKIGVRGALDRFYNEDTIRLPLLNVFQVKDVASAVKKAFGALYQAVSH